MKNIFCEAGRPCEVCGGVHICMNNPRFKIIDIECDFDKDSIFWVCDECAVYFLGTENVDNPHYIILEEVEGE